MRLHSRREPFWIDLKIKLCLALEPQGTVFLPFSMESEPAVRASTQKWAAAFKANTCRTGHACVPDPLLPQLTRKPMQAEMKSRSWEIVADSSGDCARKCLATIKIMRELKPMIDTMTT